MTMPARHAISALTEKEKQTLRLIVRGHDAKSTARSLGLSVHTINERLRDARRKMAVSSSREAARLLFEVEVESAGGGAAAYPELSVDAEIGADAPHVAIDHRVAPSVGVGLAHRRPAILVGVLVMTLALAFLALAALPHGAAPAPPAGSAAPADAANAEVIAAAQNWLELLDQARWEESYRLTGTAFRKLNTAQVWARVSERVRGPLGAMVSRTLESQDFVPAPPSGYEVVKFRTAFANKPAAIETVSFVREGDAWRVVGVTVG